MPMTPNNNNGLVVNHRHDHDHHHHNYRWVQILCMAFFVLWDLRVSNPSAYIAKRNEIVFHTNTNTNNYNDGSSGDDEFEVLLQSATTESSTGDASGQGDTTAAAATPTTTTTASIRPAIRGTTTKSESTSDIQKEEDDDDEGLQIKIAKPPPNDDTTTTTSTTTTTITTATCTKLPRESVIANATLTDYTSTAVVGHRNAKKTLSRLTFFIDKKPFVPKQETSLLQTTTATTNSTMMTEYYATCRFMDHMWSFHFPHAMQQLYRCWSFWRLYPQHIPIFVTTGNKKYWNSAMNSNFTGGVIRLLPKLGIQVLDPADVGEEEVEKDSPSSSSSVSVRPAPLTTFQEVPHYQTPSVQDMHALRDEIVKIMFQNNDVSNNDSMTTNATPTIDYYDNRQRQKFPRVAVLNRSKNRNLGNAKAIIDELKNSSLPILLNDDDGKDIPEIFFEGTSFQDQIEAFSKVDIVITPHGAQETGLIFMPNCGGVLEILPDQYYYPKFFGSLAATAGLSHGYVYMGELEEEQQTSYYGYNISWRDVPTMCPPPSRVKEGVALLVKEWQRCRQKEHDQEQNSNKV